MAEARDSTAHAEMKLLARRIGRDLRAPLRALRNVPQWVREELATGTAPISSKTDEYLSMIECQAERMDRHLTGLLEYSQVAAMDGIATNIDPETEFKTVLHEIAAKGSYTVQISPDLAQLNVVRSDFATIVRHIVANAVRHHEGQHAQIQVRGSHDGKLAVFEVQDDGPGISEDNRERIFEPFVTLKPRDQVEGSGLGLAVVRKILSHWGGTISVSPAAGGGSVFRFQFPVNPAVDRETDADPCQRPECGQN